MKLKHLLLAPSSAPRAANHFPNFARIVEKRIIKKYIF
jgi:hypothetical protein